MVKLIINGGGAVFGRLGSFAAKELLKGNSIDIINCEKIVISGDKKNFVEKILRKRRMGRGGSMKGPRYIRQEDRLVKRMIRGMLPRNNTKGKEAFKRLKCHIGEGNFKKEELKNTISFDSRKLREYSTIKEIVVALK